MAKPNVVAPEPASSNISTLQERAELLADGFGMAERTATPPVNYSSPAALLGKSGKPSVASLWTNDQDGREHSFGDAPAALFLTESGAGFSINVSWYQHGEQARPAQHGETGQAPCYCRFEGDPGSNSCRLDAAVFPSKGGPESVGELKSIRFIQQPDGAEVAELYIWNHSQREPGRKLTDVDGRWTRYEQVPLEQFDARARAEGWRGVGPEMRNLQLPKNFGQSAVREGVGALASAASVPGGQLSAGIQVGKAPAVPE